MVVAGALVRLFGVLPYTQHALSNLMATQQMSIASYVANDIDHSILERRALLVELGTTLPATLLQQPVELAHWLQERQKLNPLFNKGLVLLRADGRGALAHSAQVAGIDPLNYADSDWFQAALLAHPPILGKPQRERASGKPILIMALALRDSAQHVVAVLTGVAALDAPGFLDLQDRRLGVHGGFLVVSPADHLFVSSSDPTMTLQPTPAAGVNPLHDRAMAGYRGTGITLNAQGIEELSAMVTIPSTGWFVVARMPTAEALQPIAALRAVAWKVTLTALVLMILILTLALPYILRPLTAAARTMREMADGKRELAALPVERQDEVGALILVFNQLVARLQKKEAALKASEARLGHLAHHDALTGLYSRVMLEDHLQQALVRAERDGSRFALLFCDLDDFKPINDQCGHEAGDVILRQVALRLQKGRRSADTIARFGGDEFVILMSDLDDAHYIASLVAEQLLLALTEPFVIDQRSFVLGVSIGIALGGGVAGVCHSAASLIGHADSAMYQAKRAGKNQICVYSESVALRA